MIENIYIGIKSKKLFLTFLNLLENPWNPHPLKFGFGKYHIVTIS